MKLIDKTLKWIVTAAPAIVAGVLAVTVSLAESDLEASHLAEDRQAAEQGDADAQFRLGIRYSTFGDADSVAKDEAEATRWYRLAAEQGHAPAQTILGLRYDYGQGVPKDEAEATRWYRLAAEQGHAGAQYNLGFMYDIGQGVPKDSVRAHMWFNIASANGDETARTSRDSVEKEMNRAEISRATALARTCMASGYQDCEP